jgi:hypothetical protein
MPVGADELMHVIEKAIPPERFREHFVCLIVRWRNLV